MSNTIVASVASQPTATGDAYQQHLVYAPNSGVWWFFYLSGTTTLNALYSSDLVTWNTPTGATSTLPANHNNEGRAFSVAVASIASVDVLHIHAYTNTGSAQTDAHLRATVTASAITWGSWATVFTSSLSGITTGTVGVSVAIDSNNKPWFLDNGTTGDANARQATNADTGSAWTAGWGSEATIQSYPTAYMGFGKIIALASGNMLAIMDQATTGPNLGTMASSKWTTSWSATSAPFAGTDAHGLNNAGVVKLSNTDVHAVRWDGSALLHERYNATSWSAGDSMTTLTGVKTDAGIALASDGTSVWLFVIDSGAANAVKYSKWTSGSGWAAWTTLEASSATRNAVQVHQVPGGTTLALCWTEGASTPFAIKGSTLSTSGGATPAPMPPQLWPPLTLPTPTPARPALPAYPTATPPGFTFPLFSPPASGIVSGGGALIANAALVETAAQVLAPGTLQANAALAAPAVVVSPSSDVLQANAVLAETAAQVVAPTAPEQANAALTDTHNLVICTAAVMQANAALAASAVVISPAADTLQATALLGAATQQVVEPSAPLVANAVLSATGSLAGQGGGNLIANAVLSVSGQVVTPSAALVANAALAAGTVVVRAGGQTLQANAALSAPAVVQTSSAVAQANAVLSGTPAVGAVAQVTSNAAVVLSSARVLGAAPVQATSVLSAQQVRLLATVAVMQANAVLVATGTSGGQTALVNGAVTALVRDGSVTLAVRDGTVSANGRDGRYPPGVR